MLMRRFFEDKIEKYFVISQIMVYFALVFSMRQHKTEEK